MARKNNRRAGERRRSQSHDADVLIIGSGIGGLFLALQLAESARVTVVTKKEDFESNTNYAQGGIAVVTSDEDSFHEHLRDTMRAGAGLCDRNVVRTIVREGPERLRDLIELGVRFSREHGTLHLGREGGHSHRRIVHAGDFTGKEIERALLRAVLEHSNIQLLEQHLAVDLILSSRISKRRRRKLPKKLRGFRDEVWGAYVLDRDSGRIRPIRARATVVAAGGSGKVYLYTSNPDIATGDGVAMAYRAGARIANMEFVQFHPTCLYHPQANTFLISEAVRGEGAVLTTIDGKRFMRGAHPLGDLAPRDIVARTIDREMKRRGEKYVLLDLEPIGRERIKKQFPSIYRRCRSLGYDPTHEPLPVVPAAHYQCGGIQTDLSGQSSLGRMFAIGEVGMTGLHGANRLASNSLLEAVVIAARAVDSIREILRRDEGLPEVDAWQEKGTRVPVESAALAHNWEAIRRLMWDRVGIVRSDERLASASELLGTLRREVQRDYKRYRLDADVIELRNIALVADIVIRSARRRKESRGLHYNIDHPKRSIDFRRNTVLTKKSKRSD